MRLFYLVAACLSIGWANQVGAIDSKSQERAVNPGKMILQPITILEAWFDLDGNSINLTFKVQVNVDLAGWDVEAHAFDKAGKDVTCEGMPPFMLINGKKIPRDPADTIYKSWFSEIENKRIAKGTVTTVRRSLAVETDEMKRDHIKVSSAEVASIRGRVSRVGVCEGPLYEVPADAPIKFEAKYKAFEPEKKAAGKK